MSNITTVRPRIVRHVSIDSGQPYATFRTAYKTAVPRSTASKRWAW